MKNLEDINEIFRQENPKLDSIRKNSKVLINIVKLTIIPYLIFLFISIPFGNMVTIGLFLGLIPLIIFLHHLTAKRVNYEQELKVILPKYLKLLAKAQPFKTGYTHHANSQQGKESTFFSLNLDPFIMECRDQIKIEGNKNNLIALNVDFKHSAKKNRSVDFYWKESILICFDTKTGMHGKNLMIPISYFQSSSDEDGSKQFNRVMPLRGLFNNKSFPLKEYVFFTDKRLNTFDVESDNFLRVKTIITNFYKGKQKFISITENSIYFLIFNTRLFKADINESIYKNNIFTTFENEIQELNKMNRSFNSEN